MTLRITIEVGEKNFKEVVIDGRMTWEENRFDALIRESVDIDRFTKEDVDGYENNVIEIVRDVTIKLRKSMEQ